MERLTLGSRVPALLWGGPSERLFLAAHGSQSNKADAAVTRLAGIAAERGYQVLSFDLPGHGGRQGVPCTLHNCLETLATAMAYAKGRWPRRSLFGCSLGAYCSLLSYGAEALEQCLFLSPVVDMGGLIESMLAACGQTLGGLERAGTIPTPMGPTLYWEDYCYIKAHPLQAWPHPTAILWGSLDALCSRETITAFAARFGCDLDVLEAGEHYFHTPEQLAYYSGWLAKRVPPAGAGGGCAPCV